MASGQDSPKPSTREELIAIKLVSAMADQWIGLSICETPFVTSRIDPFSSTTSCVATVTVKNEPTHAITAQIWFNGDDIIYASIETFEPLRPQKFLLCDIRGKKIDVSRHQNTLVVGKNSSSFEINIEYDKNVIDEWIKGTIEATPLITTKVLQREEKQKALCAEIANTCTPETDLESSDDEIVQWLKKIVERQEAREAQNPEAYQTLHPKA